MFVKSTHYDVKAQVRSGFSWDIFGIFQYKTTYSITTLGFTDKSILSFNH